MTGRHNRSVSDAGVAAVGARNVTYARAGRVILGDVSIEARAGEVLAITGPSGSGKSTLLALLAGLDSPDSGEVLINGVPRAAGRRTGFGLVLQGNGLIGMLTASENVEIALQASGIARADVGPRAAAALASVGIEALGPHLIEELSGGQQQRVAIARALVTEPAVLLADELTAELDSAIQQTALELVFNRAEAGAVVVLATHDRQIAALADREAHLSDGILDWIR
jgi:putative ABC transport system ATP-binding protein